MKKTSRKLFAAVASLGLAVAATAGSTYAWFSMNQEVTVVGMQMKVQGESTLLVSTQESTNAKGKLSTGANSIDFDMDISNEDGIKPTSTINAEDWFYATAIDADSYEAEEGTGLDVSASMEDYVLHQTFYLQLFDGAKEIDENEGYDATDPLKDIILETITIECDANDPLAPSIRAIVKYDNTLIFAKPTINGTWTGNGVSGLDGDSNLETAAISSWATASVASTQVTPATTPATYNKYVATLLAGNVLVEEVNYNEVYEVEVFFYFDGEDASVYTDNLPTADKLATYNLSLKFGLAANA